MMTKIRAVQTFDSVGDDSVKDHSKVAEFGPVFCMNPASNISRFFRKHPVCGLIDEKMAGISLEHEKGD
jgi:hypothetical protein